MEWLLSHSVGVQAWGVAGVDAVEARPGGSHDPSLRRPKEPYWNGTTTAYLLLTVSHVTEPMLLYWAMAAARDATLLGTITSK